jgi:tetratricopeptide (TPR) repeat protein
MTLEHAIGLLEWSWKLQEAGRLTEASRACSEALRLMEALEGPTSPDVANLLNELAEIEQARQSFASALTLVERARSIESVLGDRFTGEDAARIRIGTLARAGALHRIQGDYPRAESDLRNALTLAVDQFGDTSEDASAARNNLGVLYKYWGRFDDGLRLYTEALGSIVALNGEQSLAAAAVYHNIGGILHARGDHAGAEEPARKAWDITRRQLGDDEPRTMIDAAAYAAVLDGLDRSNESEPIYRQALAIFEQAYGPDHEEIASTLHNLGAVLAARGEHPEAERCYKRALAIRELLLDDESPDVALTRNNLGKLLTEMDRPAEATSLLKSAVAALEKQLMPGHPHLRRIRENLKNAHRCQDLTEGEGEKETLREPNR